MPRVEWLSYVGQFGNNYRFRWTLPRDEMSRIAWAHYGYSLRFSTDGLNWSRIGPRTVSSAAGEERSIRSEGQAMRPTLVFQRPPQGWWTGAEAPRRCKPVKT